MRCPQPLHTHTHTHTHHTTHHTHTHTTHTHTHTPHRPHKPAPRRHDVVRVCVRRRVVWRVVWFVTPIPKLPGFDTQQLVNVQKPHLALVATLPAGKIQMHQPGLQPQLNTGSVATTLAVSKNRRHIRTKGCPYPTGFVRTEDPENPR